MLPLIFIAVIAEGILYLSLLTAIAASVFCGSITETTCAPTLAGAGYEIINDIF